MNKYLIVAVALFSFSSAWSWRSSIADADLLEAQNTYLEILQSATETLFDLARLRDGLLADNAELHAQLRTEREKKNQIITNRVIEYVQSDIERHDLPVGWVRLHNASASGDADHFANASGAPDGAASGVTDTQAIVTIVDNYQTCNALRFQLIELQDWVRINASQSTNTL